MYRESLILIWCDKCKIGLSVSGGPMCLHQLFGRKKSMLKSVLANSCGVNSDHG